MTNPVLSQSSSQKLPPLAPADITRLQRAQLLLENPGLAAKLTDLVGKPIEIGFSKLPECWRDKVGTITRDALMRALRLAVLSLGDDRGRRPRKRLHKVSVAATGAIGGTFGFTALAIELPASTLIMLRSIAEIARSEGESLSSFDARLACLEVFALGGRTSNDDATEVGYYAVRAAIARAVSEAAQFIAEKGAIQEGAPVLARLIIQIAERFSIQVSQKAAAQAIPIAGAMCGLSINVMFISHFQQMAEGHFIIRRLERAYGRTAIEAAYRAL